MSFSPVKTGMRESVGTMHMVKSWKDCWDRGVVIQSHSRTVKSGSIVEFGHLSGRTLSAMGLCRLDCQCTSRALAGYILFVWHRSYAVLLGAIFPWHRFWLRSTYFLLKLKSHTYLQSSDLFRRSKWELLSIKDIVQDSWPNTKRRLRSFESRNIRRPTPKQINQNGSSIDQSYARLEIKTCDNMPRP